MRGRKPTADIIKFTRGTARKSRVNTQAPKIEKSLPKPPEFLSPIALEEWNRVVSILDRARMVSALDQAILAAYASSYDDWITALNAFNAMARKDPVTSGRLITTTNGNFIQNPLLGIANKARSDMVKYAAELGITPVSRGRVRALEPDSAPEKYDI